MHKYFSTFWDITLPQSYNKLTLMGFTFCFFSIWNVCFLRIWLLSSSFLGAFNFHLHLLLLSFSRPQVPSIKFQVLCPCTLFGNYIYNFCPTYQVNIVFKSYSSLYLSFPLKFELWKQKACLIYFVHGMMHKILYKFSKHLLNWVIC